MCFKLALFDLDMTLVDTLRAFYRSFAAALDSLTGATVSYSTFVEHFCRESLEELIPEGVDRDAFWRLFRRLYVGVEDAKLMPGAYEALNAIKSRDMTVVVITGREVSAWRVWSELRRLGVVTLVDWVYTAADLREGEEEVLFDKTQLIKRALNRYRTEPRRAFYVGDYWLDMASARRAGVVAIGLGSDCRDPGRLLAYGAVSVIRSLRELPPLIEELCRGR